jgi:hypothetical protein
MKGTILERQQGAMMRFSEDQRQTIDWRDETVLSRVEDKRPAYQPFSAATALITASARRKPSEAIGMPA